MAGHVIYWYSGTSWWMAGKVASQSGEDLDGRRYRSKVL